MTDYDDDGRLEQLDYDFQQVLNSLAGDASLARFKEEYAKIHASLRKSHDNERRLVKKVKELNTEILSNATKVSTALKLSEEDSITIDELKKQVERAWTMVEAANTREEQANVSIEHLQGEISSLRALVQKQTALLGADTTIEDLLSTRDMLSAKIREAEQAVAHERQRVDELTQEVTVRQEKHKEKKAQIKELERQIAVKASEEAREAKKRANMEADMVKLREQLQQRMVATEQMKKAVEDAEEKNQKLEKQLQQQRYAMSNSLNDFQKLHQNTSKLAEQLDERTMRNEQLTEHNMKLEREVRERAEELSREKTQIARLQSKLETEAKERERLQRALEDEKLETTKTKAELVALQRDLDAELLRYRSAEKTVAKLDREKTSAEKRVAYEGAKLADTKHEVEAKATEVVSLENENRRLLMEATKMRTVISVLERDREKMRQQMEDVERRWREAQEDVRLRESQIQDMEKKEVDTGSKLKQSQAMYENLRAERNTIAKQLLEAQNEISELKRKSKVQTSQIEQLKDDIHGKDRALVAEQFEHQSVEKRLEQRTHEVEQLKRLLDEANINVTKQDNEISELNTTIRRLDAEALAQKRAYDQVVTERDILGTQLIRRNDELALLYEKLSIQASTLSKGEAQYKERMEDIRLIKIKVADLKREVAVATVATSATSDLKREVARLQRELLQEQTKVKALSEELENPMNVHRWRKLEGSDPATYEMIQKIQTLQKRLISKTEEVVEKDMLLAEKEKMYAELKAMLARQPGPEVAEQVAHYQHLLNERTRQLKALASELNMYQAQLQEQRYEMERVMREMLELKKQHYELKHQGRRGSALNATLHDRTSPTQAAATGEDDRPIDTAAHLAEQQKQVAQAAVPRFVGGGFNVQSAVAAVKM